MSPHDATEIAPRAAAPSAGRRLGLALLVMLAGAIIYAMGGLVALIAGLPAGRHG